MKRDGASLTVAVGCTELSTMMRRLVFLTVAGRRDVVLSAAGARSNAPPQLGSAAGAEAAGDSEAPALERPAGLDRRAARGAGRAGEPGRLQRERRRSGGQVRRREPDGGDARGGRRARDRRSRSPTRSIFSAPISAATAASTRRPSGCTCRSRVWPTRCRSWPTSRCGRRSRTTSSNGCGASG